MGSKLKLSLSVGESWGAVGLGHTRAHRSPLMEGGVPHLQLVAAVMGCRANANMSSCFTRQARSERTQTEFGFNYLKTKQNTMKAKLSLSLGQNQLPGCPGATSHLDNGLYHRSPSSPFLLFLLLSISTSFSPNHSHSSFLY